MVNPMEIMPVLAMAFAITCIPLLGDGPFDRSGADPEPAREPEFKPAKPIRLPHPRR
jgi:hypothetical protein